MILSKQQYKDYLEMDRIALRIPKDSIRFFLKDLFLPAYNYKFQKLLRKVEYIKNCKSGFGFRMYYLWLEYRFRRLSMKLGFSIPLNVFGPGLAIVHYGTIVVSAYAKIGANCRIHPSTCIGASSGTTKAPTIGDNVYIAPGVKIFGDIRLANNIATAANAAVSKSFEEENILIGGVPAVKIKNIDITGIIKHLKK